MIQDIKFSSQELITRLTNEFGYSSNVAQKIAKKLISMDVKVKEPFWTWWISGNEPEDFIVNGYTLARLREEFGLNTVATFLTLDWMLREPDIALSTLKKNDYVI